MATIQVRMRTDATPEQLLLELAKSPLIYIRLAGIVSDTYWVGEGLAELLIAEWVYKLSSTLYVQASHDRTKDLHALSLDECNRILIHVVLGKYWVVTCIKPSSGALSWLGFSLPFTHWAELMHEHGLV